ncbi:MAG: alpha/beta hydrolase [Alphaproteobacteria bacterium]
MALKPQLVEILNAMKALNLPRLAELEPRAARAQIEKLAVRPDLPPVDIAGAKDTHFTGPAGEVRVRIYRPNEPLRTPTPVLIYYHGGGHVIGSLNTHDRTARYLCRYSGCMVVSVDYRMGPEHKFPAAVEDSYAALEWVAANAEKLGADPARIAVGGDSAGGNLALVVSLLSRDNDGPKVGFQLLVYPVMDYTGGTPSYEPYGKGYGPLDTDAVDWFRKHYTNDGSDLADWRCSPSRAESFAGLPRTLLITAECDVLNWEGTEAAKRLKAEGVDVTHVDFPGVIHAFFGYAPTLDDATKAQKLAAEHMRQAFGETP